MLSKPAKAPGSSFPESHYQADPADPFPASPSDLDLDGIGAKFLGFHYCVRCDVCTEDKTFSRADALTRHHRVCHPDVEFPGWPQIS
ncbi:hypothetical protein F5883DRAFT_645406 [Diaporthe sp. PMI_573]|nr:hypothetical protein F5883DRAFT_645406 [Diaporthaceae sp. PMI_573]